ncbi:right-handed parallel beta-helix repeat-containing protein [Puniceicoccales bacterium CK1056]|uniref:Right-handed parallel beta-helix repeat-containing protein n=1 Tax=Oceanipulchritudo coccoides TaxID=2706888 RepID=A0A6B2LYE5_9BACT|nr:right-handed parallel beta-helix repeat-containing protein [Oceanipulchritudo coccoides]NDV61671.1 right-handed parallel beta-helix repeat-containing protein [Oceanipulchritudo coccoides]
MITSLNLQRPLSFLGLVLFMQLTPLSAATYYLDADGGNDLNLGTSPAQAWATLDEVNSRTFLPGDQILLQAGDTFNGKIYLDGDSGSAGNPIIIASYDSGPAPVINASGYLAGVHLEDTAHVEVRDLEITGDGGAMVDGSPEDDRYGVFMSRTGTNGVQEILIDNLYIHHIYPSIGTPNEGATPTTYTGFGIAISGGDASVSGNIVVSNCAIENVGHKAIQMRDIRFVEILDNVMTDIGGPAIQPSRVDDLVVRGNVVDGSGVFIDSRMHGRGSGIWPFASDRVLIEKNTFKGARGRADSCGMHIDFNCNDVVVQYNLSIDNAGGFIEILGNNNNCSYRYNISINDGWRVKGALDQGTIANHQDGNIIWTSGYVGSGNPLNGPFNSYLYNNTIYVDGSITGKFNINDSTDGLLIANNIFYVLGPTADVTGDNADDYTQAMADRVVWMNNLYQRTNIVPTFNLDLFTETAPLIGNPLFANTGGLTAADYIPSSTSLVEDQGILITPITGDPVGLAIGLDVATDYFGNPVVGLPDMGAIEIGGTPFPLPPAAFDSVPTALDSYSVQMTSIEGPFNTEYYFTETSGNLGGDDSGWQSSPVYTDTGLLPNTAYAYTVTMRDALDVAGTASAVGFVLTLESSPYGESPVVLSEDFSTNPNPANTAAPYPSETWHQSDMSNWRSEDNGQTLSVNSSNGGLRTGFGYDEIVTRWFSTRTWDTSKDYRFSGDWEIAAVLDVHVGLIVGIGEFDPVSGDLIQRIKEVTIGDLTSPAAGQTGSFILDLSSAELVSAGVSETSLVGVFFHHDDDGTLFNEGPSLRNDVYVVDDLLLVVLGVLEDLDGDGIADVDEPGLGLNPGNTGDGAEDLDGDGRSNFSEYLTGNILNDGSDFFSPDFSINAGVPELRIPGSNVLDGRLYILEHATNLGASNPWTAVDAVLGSSANPGTDIVFQHPLVGNRSFFRVRVQWE